MKSRSDSAIATTTALGLSDVGIRITLNTRYDDIMVDAWGQEVPVDVQTMLSDAQINMTLVHFDRGVLDVVLALSMGGGGISIGQVVSAGQRLGQGLPIFSPGNSLISLNLTSPVGNKPFLFPTTYLTGPGMEYPIGTKRSIVNLNWRALPYAFPTQANGGIADPYNGGLGSQGVPLWQYAVQ